MFNNKASQQSAVHRTLAVAMTMAACLGISSPASAQAWPNKPIKIIVPYAVGQGTDILTRYVSDALGKELGQSVIVENRPGAGGNVGTQAAARSPTDGYNFMIGTNATHAANAYLYSHPGYDAKNDFEPVAMMGVLPLVYVTKPDSPVNTIPELVSAARAKPDSLNIAISTTTCRVTQELFKSKANAPLFTVDFKGSAQGLSAVMGGQVDYMVDTIASLRGAILNKQVKALGVTSAHSSKLLPGVKSLAEQGIAGYELVGWTMLFAPKGTPAEAIRKMSEAMHKVIAKPEAQEKLMQLGMELQPMTQEELRQFIETESKKWGQLIQLANIQPMS
jgi:tripartite-type tricarboxylate transporter receptor subunit TctC